MTRYIPIILLSTVSALANAAVVDSASVGGYTTFQDTNTGRVWLDLDNFFNDDATIGTSGYNMIGAAQQVGFTFATRSDVGQLLGSLPLGNGEWSSYAAVMGYGIPRSLIWGMYDDGDGNPYGYAWAYSTETSWSFQDNVTDANSIQNEGSIGSVDMGIWAYQTGTVPIPEPAILSILGLGLAGLAFSRRSSKDNKG